MTVWSHLPTILRWRFALRTAGIIAVSVAFITTPFFTIPAHADQNVTQVVSFQGRLRSPNGGLVPDGNYNIQFKIYQDTTSVWTETYTNNNGTTGVSVKDGYFSVKLGSATPFGTSVDWSRQDLYLSINVAGSAAACTIFNAAPCAADGEMTPKTQITAVPYAVYSQNSSMLNGKTSDDFIQNSTTAQTGNFNITGIGQANTLKAITGIGTPSLDALEAGTGITIGSSNAASIGIGSAGTDQTISIGTGNGNKTITLGSTSGDSGTTINAGGNGVRIATSGGFVVNGARSGVDSLVIDSNSNSIFNLGQSNFFTVRNSSGNALFSTLDNGIVGTGYGTAFVAGGSATFNNGITIQGNSGLSYTTPGGYNLSTAISIPNYAVPNYSSILAFGLPSSSSATARGILVADARSENHQATIGVLSPDEGNIMGFSWNGSNTTGTISNTASTLALQGNGLTLLTATNSGGSAKVGIGNNATSGYALDVTGDTNTSTQYRINGSTTLTNSTLSFSGNSASTVAAASGQQLTLTSDTNIQIGDGNNTGTATRLTLDRGTSAPTGDAEDLYGSMYYDTTLGKVQCYEEDGWGACGAAPDSFVTISPEYANAVMNGADIGTISSDLCSDTLNINDGSASQPTVCGSNETYNFYKWTSGETSTQTRSIFVTYQLPGTFKKFIEGTTSLAGRTDSNNAAVTYQIYRDHPDSALSACGSVTSVSTGSQSTWQKGTATGSADPANCGFEANDSVLVRINLSSKDDAKAYVSNINFVYSNE